MPPSAEGPVTRPHLPLRPLWLCRACAAPWPCATARLTLIAEYAHDRIALSVYLCAVLHEAAADLYRLDPDEGPTPAALFARFLAWVPRPGARP
ncbi:MULTISPECIES: hypothetical protein [Micromonospora]|uniref:Flavin reductase n=1 Tax=Micromonospora maris TaxID=1003110 RepID=A0A9X0I4H0_9ACTN|nr:hypothetical protein [Micromonospora maris]KUJ46635.1 hypothetical protein ADL17_27480 [Micromonospora maris]